MFIKNHKKLNKRGFTLIELTMVMAIAAIISIMIVTLTSLISEQVNKNDLRADFMEDVLNLRTELQIEFAEIDGTLSSPYDFTIDGETLKIENSAFEFSLSAYEYIDEVNLSTSNNGEILKISLKNSTLNETQSFVMISKTGNKFAV